MNSLFALIFSQWDWMIILVIAFLLFGNRLPTAMRSLGRGVTEFKKGLEGSEDDVDAAAKKAETGETKKATEQPAKT